jgi:hypothetical protein
MVGSSVGHGAGQSSQRLNEDDQIDLNDLFSARRPKDLKAGLSSGLKSLGKGVLAGAVGLVSAPYIGAKEGGAAGCAKGVAAGVASAVVLPVVGAGFAGVQSTIALFNAMP